MFPLSLYMYTPEKNGSLTWIKHLFDILPRNLLCSGLNPEKDSKSKSKRVQYLYVCKALRGERALRFTSTDEAIEILGS